VTDLSVAERQNLIREIGILKELQRRHGQRLFYRLFPDEDVTGDDGEITYGRAKYPKHLEFFEAGAKYRERCFLAANRVGKSVAGAYETACHLTGEYPDWWKGRRFPKPIRAWAAGKTNETTRDIVQTTLLGTTMQRDGRKTFTGTGVIPGHAVGSATWKQGVTDLADTIKIRHVSGGWSTLGLKSYQQGRGSFEGTAQHVIWPDEECPLDIYNECLIRTATTNGLILHTFTPLDGLTEVVLHFLPQMGA